MENSEWKISSIILVRVWIILFDRSESWTVKHVFFWVMIISGSIGKLERSKQANERTNERMDEWRYFLFL